MPKTLNYAERLLQAELNGKIRRYYYSYSPENTTADRRYVFTELDGTERRLFSREMPAYLASIGA